MSRGTKKQRREFDRNRRTGETFSEYCARVGIELPAYRINDTDREGWINSDEFLYNSWRSTGKGISTFIRLNRGWIDDYIKKQLDRKGK